MADDQTGPKPGHFLPGGAGDAGDDAGTSPMSRPAAPKLSRKEPLKLSGPHPQQEIKNWSQTRGRRVAQSAPFDVSRRLTMPMIAGISVLALFVVGGGAALALKLIGSYDGLVENPLSAPSARPPSPGASGQPEASPTVTVTATPTPDAIVVRKNGIYSTGRLAAAKCKEPGFRPTSKQNVLKFYRAMLPCLNRVWAPAVREAGHEFRAPKVAVFDGVGESECSGFSGQAHYCGADETIHMPWPKDVGDYRKYDKLGVRLGMAQVMAHEYAHHVQTLTAIMSASHSREDNAPSKKAALEESRRLELQADCLAAAYLGADKKYFPITGRMLDRWDFLITHRGDAYNPVRDHGSLKSVEYWNKRGFATQDPKYCNTFNAPAAQVS